MQQPHLPIKIFFKSIGRNLAAFFIPPTCPLCQTTLAPTEPFGLCPPCWKNLPKWDTSQNPMPHLPKNLDGFYAPFLYDHTARDLILQFKFSDKTELAPILAPFLSAQWHHLPSQLTQPLIVPIPLHHKRLRKRLFNQAALLAHLVSKQTKIPCDSINCLKKTKNHQPQAQKTAINRQKLSKTTFKHHKTSVKNRDIILIDDIFTTGSTLNAAAHQLKKAGAARVFAITAAYTPPNR